MTEELNQSIPRPYFEIDEETKASGFTMASDKQTCTLLKTLAATKPGGKFLELGTGTGLSTSWILDGMDQHSSLISIDNDSKFLSIARKYLGMDSRLSLIDIDGSTWIKDNIGLKFDYIFADTWPGKYLMLDETLELLTEGGLYLIDDMLPQSNWPEGHDLKADHLVAYLESRKDLILTKLHWASGIILAVKRSE